MLRPSSVWTLCIGAAIGIACGLAIPRRLLSRRDRHEPIRMTLRGPLADFLPQSGIAELAGSLAHELNQPLTAITSNAQAAREFLASNTFNQELLSEILDDMINDASRASDIVRGVRALVLGEAPRMVSFSIADVVDQALDLARPNAKARGVIIHRELADVLPRAVGDPVEIRLVLLNLLVNALDAVAAGRPSGDRLIWVRARADGNTIRMAMQDNGGGVAPDDLDKIFRPFYSSKPKGMGLGLSLCRALMERNGGHIEAISNSGEGMTFECVLPREAEAHPRASVGRTVDSYPAVFRWR
ncbi:sensor histidine kinase [Cupriavidus pampae]|nr:HAMP domain-containing sensor histidine kinase [Cupriavidus pampae]